MAPRPAPVIEIRDLPPGGLYPRLVKPACDRLLALAVLLFLAPLLAVLAILVRLDSPGGAFFVQERIGFRGHPFPLYKFRSMVTGAAQMGSGALVEKGDGRITRMGRILRATSFDELPQLFNILRGEMSLIGPRPTLEYQVRQYDEFQRRRLLVKPGVTGLAQIRGRKSLDWPARIRADVEYVDSLSAGRDLWIALATPWTLLRGEGQAQGDYWKDGTKPSGSSGASGASGSES